MFLFSRFLYRHTFISTTCIATFPRPSSLITPYRVHSTPISAPTFLCCATTPQADTEAGEYGLEVQFPFIARALEGQEASLVPILVGAAMTAESEAVYGQILAPYVNDPSTVLIVSTDLCHFGDEFEFTAPATEPLAESTTLAPESAMVPSASSSTSGSSPSKATQSTEQQPQLPPQPQPHSINLEIARLDAHTMRAIESCSAAVFTQFITTQRNSVCGRHAIAILLHAVQVQSSDDS